MIHGCGVGLMRSIIVHFLDEGPIYWCGFIGSGINLFGFIIAAIPFHDRLGRSYSIMNFFVSELGDIIQSPLSIVFNSSLVIGGLLYGMFFIGLRRYFSGKSGRVAAITGAVSAISAALVGLLPMNLLMPHLAAALAFFYTGFAAVILLTRAVLREKKRPFPLWIAAIGAILFAIFTLFVFAPSDPGMGYMAMFSIREFVDLIPIIRPRFWPIALLEWMAVLGLIVWVLVMSLSLALSSMVKRELRDAAAHHNAA